jgi:single-strand DNA-binding protein
MLTKGTKIAITGELTNRQYADKSGVPKYSLELRVNDLTLLGKKDDSKPSQSAKQKTAEPVGFDDVAEDIPF